MKSGQGYVFAAACLGTAIASWPLPVAAQNAERDPAAAQALFDEGRALMRAQRYAQACLKLAESQNLDPGIGTQFHLADCYEREGKLASAWASFLEVASQARASGHAEREELALKRAAKLEPRLPRLKVVVPDSAQSEGLQIRRNGIPVRAAQWDSWLPVDPGEHELSVSAPGRRPSVQRIHVQEGTRASLEIPGLETTADLPEVRPPSVPASASSTRQAARASTPKPPASSAGGAASPMPPADAGASQASSGISPWVIGLGAVGVVGLGTGAVFGLLAQRKYDDSKNFCNARDENRCSERGVESRDDAFALGNVSTAAFIVGGAVLAGAGVLWLTAPDAKTAHARGVRNLRAGVHASSERAALIVQGQL
jgi:serine/threonine-protein kinase